MSDIPEWAKNRVRELISDQYGEDWYMRYAPIGVIEVFANYIVQYEQPPVDELTLIARELCREAGDSGANDWIWGMNTTYDTDECDYDEEMLYTIKVLKRGIELGKSQ